MDKEDAEAFTALCRIAVQIEGDCTPIIIASKFNEYKLLVGIDLDKFLNLNALGLIEMDLGTLSFGYGIKPEKVPVKIIYFDKEYVLSEEESISVGIVLFIKPDRALCQSIDVGKLEGLVVKGSRQSVVSRTKYTKFLQV